MPRRIARQLTTQRLRRLASAAVVLLASSAASAAAQADAAGAAAAAKLVHVVYLTPADRAYRPAYESALERAITDLQGWFAAQLGGYTFTTPTDPVAWYQTPHAATWYQTNPLNPTFYAGRFWESSLDDGFALTGGRFYDPNNMWLFYIDVNPLAGEYAGGTSSVVLVGENDLRGLNRDPLLPINPQDPWDRYDPGLGRWIGGMGHELGHALGLPHPPGSPGGPDDWSLLYYGYLTYPDTYLSADEKTRLLQSGFFTAVTATPEPNGGLLLGGGLLVWALWLARRARAPMQPGDSVGRRA